MISNQSDLSLFPSVGPHRGPLAIPRSALGGCPPLPFLLCAFALMLGCATFAACPSAESAPPAYYCVGGVETQCANCAAAGLSAEPPCVWSVIPGGGGAGFFSNGQGDAATFDYPDGVSADASGVAYVADYYNDRIRAVTSSDLAIASFADGTGTVAFFSGPECAHPGSRTIYVADTLNRRIRKLTPSGVTTTLSGDGGQGTSESFKNPTGLTVDFAGVVYVAETGNHCIRKITPLGVVHTLACTGSNTPFSNGVGTSTATYNTPSGIAVDGSGTVNVGNYNKHHIRLTHPNGTVSTFAGSGITSCATYSPGEACSSAYDCTSNLCLGGCCCAASALTTAGCTGCWCWANASTTLATAETRTSPTISPALPTNLTLSCNASTSLNASVALSRVITFPQAPCHVYSLGSPPQPYYFLGGADALGMGAAPGCSS